MNFDLTKVIKGKGLKVTPVRLTVFETLSRTKRPETVKNIYKKLKKDNIDLVTLYRTLATFEKNQLVKRVDLHKNVVYYELNTEHHHHIVCTDCGRVEDFKFCNMNNLVKKIVANASYFKDVQDHDFEIFGICNACVKN